LRGVLKSGGLVFVLKGETSKTDRCVCVCVCVCGWNLCAVARRAQEGGPGICAEGGGVQDGQVRVCVGVCVWVAILALLQGVLKSRGLVLALKGEASKTDRWVGVGVCVCVCACACVRSCVFSHGH